LGESKRHKGKRILVFSFLAFLVAILGISAAGYISIGVADLQHHNTVLQSNSVVIDDYGKNIDSTYQKLLLSSVNGTSTVVNDYFADNATHYYNPDYLITNVTIAQLNNHAVNAINFTSNLHGNVSVFVGYGTNYSNFVAFAKISGGKNSTIASVSIGPSQLTGSQTSYLMFEVSFAKNVTFPSYTVHFSLNGVTSSLGSYVVGEDVGYALSGTLLFAFGILAIPHYDGGNITPNKRIGRR
jgi:hypothetical protein